VDDERGCANVKRFVVDYDIEVAQEATAGAR
jgi:hypothetical protein